MTIAVLCTLGELLVKVREKSSWSAHKEYRAGKLTMYVREEYREKTWVKKELGCRGKTSCKRKGLGLLREMGKKEGKE